MSAMSLNHWAPPPNRPAAISRAKPMVELVLEGDMDMQNADELDRCLTAGMERGRDLVVDLTGVGLIDCVCLDVLVRAARAAQALDCTLSLVAPSPLVRMTMRITETDYLFPIYTDRAVAGLPAPRRGGMRLGRSAVPLGRDGESRGVVPGLRNLCGVTKPS